MTCTSSRAVVIVGSRSWAAPAAVTCSCRCWSKFVVYGYVIMREHFHLLISEPSKGDPSVIMKVVKQRFARLLNRRRKRATAQGVLWN